MSSSLVAHEVPVSPNDRLYTAFVSSTYRDLQAERQRAASVLLDQSCLPLGMEYFPSDGREVWSLIESSMARADFFVLIIGSSYGSVEPTSGESWTCFEFRRMLELGKPMVILLKTHEPNQSFDERLERLRTEIENRHLGCQYWSNEADLAERLALSVRSLLEGGSTHGWSRVPSSAYQRRPHLWENSFYGTSWTFSRAETADRWNATSLHKRTLRALDESGVRSIRLSFARPITGHVLPFASDATPKRELVRWSRSSNVGRVSLSEKIELERKTYRQELIIDPPLVALETLDFEVLTSFPEGRFAYREDLITATSELGRLDYDRVSVKIAYPTEMLELSATFEPELAMIRGVEAVHGGSNEQTDAAETNRAFAAFNVKEDDYGKRIALLRIPKPRLGTRYRITWFLPERSPS